MASPIPQPLDGLCASPLVGKVVVKDDYVKSEALLYHEPQHLQHVALITRAIAAGGGSQQHA